MKKQFRSKNLWNVCHLSLLTFISTFALIGKVFANETPPVTERTCTERSRSSRSATFPDSLTKINTVSELAEIQPTDWAFQSLKSLIARYGVVAGDPDGKFGGNRPLTRYEFAASLTATMNQIDELINTQTANQVNQEDLENLKRLQADFSEELKILQARLDNVENRVSTIQPFSTTTKLQGEVVFAVSGVSSGEKPDGSGDAIASNLTFSSRSRLTFNTSFTGKDNLKFRLQAGNLPRINNAADTNMARLAFQTNTNNQFELSVLEYRFPIGEQATVYLEAEGGDLDDFTNILNPFFSGSGRGSISRFAQRNPIYRQGGGAGVGLKYDLSDSIDLSLGYLVDDANEPEIGFGGENYAAMAQLTLEPSDSFEVGFTYIRSYNNVNTGTGSSRANDPFDDESEAILADSFGLQSTIAVDDNLTVSGWVGFTNATAMDLPNKPEADIFNWAVTLAFVDLGGEKNLGGIAIGQPPRVTSNDFEVANQAYEDEDIGLHLEAFYRFQVSDRIAITPGLLVITNPEHKDNNTIYIYTIRTTFGF